MASSSSSSPLIPASNSQSWNYDVFLSFRGKDTRKNFVDHLYTALVQQGILTYKDDETLPRGVSIGPTLLKDIQESRIAVIVFSKNYADSSWCLDELQHIIRCMENDEQTVLPVFYDVDPSDVRKQKRKYEEAFSKHEGGNKHKVESWRKALEKAGNISGWVTNDFANGHEAKCIKDIVDKVSSRLRQLPSTNVNKDLFGIETRLQDLKSMLETGSGGVRVVGIWGVGGGGKTTLASVVYKEISHLFEAHCFLQNIREESSKHGLETLQEKFLSVVLKTKVNLLSEIERTDMIKSRLCHKSVLVVLDDVDDLKQLEALAGSHDWFGDGSRIIITTRDEHLLSRKADAIYEVSLLSHDEAIKLFRRHAYRKDKPVEDYEKLSQNVVSYANGLPLALKVLGSFLYDKNKDEWLSALAKLKEIPYPEVTKILKISYDGLEADEQSLFLDIACFFRGRHIAEAMVVLDACGFHSRIGVKVLVQKSLIIKDSDGRFDMHDLIQEMAHYIVKGEHHDNPEKWSRIWEEEDVVKLCDMGAVASSMETEALALGYSDASHPCLLDVVANMKKLRWIDYWCPASPFPSNFQPTKLRFLRLTCGLQEELWKGCKYLPNLKVLDLSCSLSLTRTPDFNGLPCLERLILHNCASLEEIHSSIGYHKRLVYVNMYGCEELQMFPPIIGMANLETLILTDCHQLQKFPDIQTNMDSLVNLDLFKTGIETVPSSIEQFCTNLVSLGLGNCENLKRIESNFHLLKCLKYLNLSSCKLLSQQPTYFRGLMRVQFLHQDSLMNSRFQRSLKRLNLRFCNLRNGDIPMDICELLNLEVLDLSGNHFSRLHSTLSRFPCLKLLNLSFCKNLVELPDLPSSIAILKVEYCWSLESVGDLSNYKWLWKVSLHENGKLIGVKRVLHSLLQGNALEDRFMSLILPPQKPLVSGPTTGSFTLQLPHNWYRDFSGFWFNIDYICPLNCTIVIKHEMSSTDSQPDKDLWEEFDKNSESYEYRKVAYVPFASLMHIPWWNNSRYSKKNILFQIYGMWNPKVGLVPRKISKTGDSIDQRAIDCSEFGDEEYEDTKTFEIKDDSKSSNSIQIEWCH